MIRQDIQDGAGVGVIDQHGAIIEGIKKRRKTPLVKILMEHIQAFQNRILLFLAS